MVFPVIYAVIAGVSTLVAGGVTYFAARSGGSSSSTDVHKSTEVQNNISVDVGQKHDYGNTLLLILVCLRVCELLIFALNSFKKSLKKKYNVRVPGQPLTVFATAQPTTLPANP